MKHVYNELRMPNECKACGFNINKWYTDATKEQYFKKHFPPKIIHELARVCGEDTITRIAIIIQYTCKRCHKRFSEVYEVR